MFVVPSALQVALAIVLVLLGVCGNLVIPFVSYRTTLRCPHITVLAALDFTATLFGPGVMLVTIVKGPTWLEHNKALCHSLSFLSSWMLITCFLVLFVLAVFCQKVRHNIHPNGRNRARRREFVFLAVCLFTGLLLGVPPLLGWSSYNGVAFSHSCTLPGHVTTFSHYSVFYVACSLLILSITIVLAIKATKRRRLYPVQVFWERHLLETKINDPEMTTTASSAYSSGLSGGRTSRTSSFSNKRSACTSARNSPMMIRKSSQKPAPLEGTLNVLLEIIARQKQSERMRAQQTGNGSGQTAESEAPQPACSSVASGSPQHGSTRDPFVISSRVPYRIPKRRRIFESPRCLPQFQGSQQQRSLSRLLLLRCCVTMLCWLLLYVTVLLQLSSVHYLQELYVFTQWLIFIQSSTCSLLPLFDVSYRQAWRRVAFSCFKACAQQNGTQADLGRSRDMESWIDHEGNQVRLREVIPLEASRL